MKKVLIAAAALTLNACATIIGSPTQTIPITSTPSEAKILVSDETGAHVFAGQTPTSVTLNKSNGRYLGKKEFNVTLSKDGYVTQNIPITSAPNGWYIGGNLLFGGLIGWLIVDPLNGGMYTLSPDTLDTSLPANPATAPAPGAHNNTATDGSISVMLLPDVPVALRDKLVRLD
ncbi:hypothetical protein GCM10007933_29680 [Zoogloea oryzae]|uniref:PEGA domain-containing protein n=1 Tax=Zoogloea oryzae TaxID=310767 RepID=A0ABQ6FF21_9RHOO|nr:hypothetical protein [Zoogloea oryzae]GLT23501.1 hypothetical protein GCM10007933_29680 [Zoogloea oryzae]